MGVRLDVKKVMPEEDARGLAILEETTKWIDDRYVIGLMWREFRPDLLSNFAAAMRRFYALERKYVNVSEPTRWRCWQT